MRKLILLLIISIAFTTNAQEVEPQLVQVNYSNNEVKEFDVNLPVKNSAEFRAVIQSNDCIATLVLKDLFYNSIKSDDILTPSSLLYQQKLGNSEAFENDFIKLGCSKDDFLRYQKLKDNNYKFLNKTNEKL